MIGFLNAYQCDPDTKEYQVRYGQMFISFFKENAPELELREYKVALGEWPKSVSECAGWIISGSPKSAYDQDAWILQLGKFVQNCSSQKINLVGICFGHQLIAHYLGGKTEKSVRGWGVGVHEFNILKHKKWMTPPQTKCSLIFSHQDQVTQLPPGAELIGESTFCPNQMYSIGEHIFCMQGHPEFTPEFANDRMASRIQILGDNLYNTATQSLSTQTDSHRVSQWIKNFFISL